MLTSKKTPTNGENKENEGTKRSIQTTLAFNKNPATIAQESPPTKKTRISNPVPAVLRITLQQATALYSSRRSKATIFDNGYPDEDSLNCWIDQGLHQNSYPSASYSHTAANIQVSHLALRVTNGVVPHKVNRETASHLCHNKSCIRPDHIIIESVGQNGRRNGCLAFVKCGNCQTRINACGHTPRCLLPFEK